MTVPGSVTFPVTFTTTLPRKLVRPRGIEPLAFGFVVRRSIHLS